MAVSFKEFIGEHPEEKTLRLGDMVNATVIEINFKKKLVLVDGGPSFKSESLISMDEFLDDNYLSEESEAFESGNNPDNLDSILHHKRNHLEIEVGNNVPVVIETLDNGYGETILSREKAKRGLAWAALQEALENKTTVQGIVTGKVRGGFTVDIGILKGFLPGSLVDAQYLEEINALSRRKFDFKVITLDYQRNNIVLSQGQISREALLNKLQEGQIVKGYVKNLADYGAFINLGGIDGLLHNSDIAWEKTTAREKFKSRDPKDPIEVIILKIDKAQERPRISLGLKQLSEDPWTHLVERYSVGMRLEKRRVTHIKEYGCFVEIEPGVEGLVHITEMDWTNRNPNLHALIQKMQDEEGRIDVVILGIDVNLKENKRRLSLGIKQCTENPWGAFAERHKEGDRLEGTIRSITDLGLFIHLEGNIDGLVHHTQIREGSSGEAATRQFKKGEMVEVVILSIDPVRERVALSMRQLDDPVETDTTIATESDSEAILDQKASDDFLEERGSEDDFVLSEGLDSVEEGQLDEPDNQPAIEDQGVNEAVDSEDESVFLPEPEDTLIDIDTWDEDEETLQVDAEK
jgi:small subunit ribosomal protein S1